VLDFATIGAVATPPGVGGIAVIRVSGPDAAGIASRVFRAGKRGDAIYLEAGNSHTIHYGRIVDPVSGETIDEVMLAWMAAPRTFTTEDTLEISCHGGPVAVSDVLRAVLAAGARPAGPGEFTMRAYLNGRLSLTEAEAVLQVVSAQTSDGLRRAIDDLRGDMTRRLEPGRQAVLSALAYLDASADFPDDEIPVSNVADDLSGAIAAVEAVLAGVRRGQLLREGATVALVGRPNVGKSSLLNALLRSERAIVTPIAGTTRDIVSERSVIDGIPVTLLDTAGIVDTLDPVEEQGVARSRRAIEHASGIVLVLDGAVDPAAADLALASDVGSRFASGALGHSSLVVAVNKVDLGPPRDQTAATSLLPTDVRSVEVSAQTGAGIEALEEAIASAIRGDLANEAQPSLLTARQHAELDRALLHLRLAQDALEAGHPTDLLATDVRAAMRALANVTGEDVDASVLAEIFSRFCIGK
jgi:tRNA modification GTPase